MSSIRPYMTAGIGMALAGVVAGCGAPRVHPTASRVPAPIRQVMRHMKGRTTVPLLMPTVFPAIHGYLAASDDPGGPTATSYNVDLFSTRTLLPGNAAVLNSMNPPPEVGSFGASKFPSAQDAINGSNRWNNLEGSVPQAPDTVRPITIGHGVSAVAYSNVETSLLFTTPITNSVPHTTKAWEPAATGVATVAIAWAPGSSRMSTGITTA